jgi:PPOX class probable F420-dependent enzyme
MSIIPESHQDLLEKPIYATVTTMMPDGQPQSTVVWFDYDGEFVRFNTARGRQKDKNLAQNNRVTFMIMEAPFRWIEVRGIAEVITEEGGRDHIESLSRRYTGQHYYGGFNTHSTPESETRVMIKVRPTKVTTVG